MDFFDRSYFGIGHGEIIGNRNQWSQFYPTQENQRCLVNSIWNTSIAFEENGDLFYRLFADQKIHLKRLNDALEMGLPIFGALKWWDPTPGAGRHISSAHYFICKPKYNIEEQLVGFNIFPRIGNILEVVKQFCSDDDFKSNIINQLNEIRKVSPSLMEGGEFLWKHNKIQNRLIASLSKKYGEGNVCFEEKIKNGKQFDVAVKKNDRYSHLYEVKTESSVTGCIRAAIGQLLQYRYLLSTPEGGAPNELIAVGEPVLTDAEKPFLEHLQALLKVSEPSIKFDYLSV